MLDPQRLHQRELLLQGRDRLRAVGRIEHASRVRLERDERWLRAICFGCGHGAPDHIHVTEMHAVKAADGEGRGSDRARRKPEMD